mmetsp:Transcript_30984/g.76003  ORF Transcript_30984/g.76003 Transcript_30984/m.76003 type:complete len:223 (-) Transcript_30984:522-1190(-)
MANARAPMGALFSTRAGCVLLVLCSLPLIEDTGASQSPSIMINWKMDPDSLLAFPHIEGLEPGTRQHPQHTAAAASMKKRDPSSGPFLSVGRCTCPWRAATWHHVAFTRACSAADPRAQLSMTCPGCPTRRARSCRIWVWSSTARRRRASTSRRCARASCASSSRTSTSPARRAPRRATSRRRSRGTSATCRSGASRTSWPCAASFATSARLRMTSSRQPSR